MSQFVETADDLNKKYGNTYCLYAGQLVYVTAFAGHGDGLQCSMSYPKKEKPKEGSATSVVNVHPKDFASITIDEMFINNIDKWKASKDGETTCPLVHFARNPRRQWKRGLTAENTKLSCPLNTLYASCGEKLNNGYNRLDFPMIERLRAPQYPSWAFAFHNVKEYQALALSKMFALMVSNQSTTKYLICSPFGFVAEAVPDRIFVKHPPAMQELTDFVRRNELAIGIELDSA